MQRSTELDTRLPDDKKKFIYICFSDGVPRNVLEMRRASGSQFRESRRNYFEIHLKVYIRKIALRLCDLPQRARICESISSQTIRMGFNRNSEHT